MASKRAKQPGYASAPSKPMHVESDEGMDYDEDDEPTDVESDEGVDSDEA